MPEVVCSSITEGVLFEMRSEAGKEILLFHNIAQHVDQRGSLEL